MRFTPSTVDRHPTLLLSLLLNSLHESLRLLGLFPKLQLSSNPKSLSPSRHRREGHPEVSKNHSKGLSTSSLLTYITFSLLQVLPRCPASTLFARNPLSAFRLSKSIPSAFISTFPPQPPSPWQAPRPTLPK